MLSGDHFSNHLKQPDEKTLFLKTALLTFIHFPAFECQESLLNKGSQLNKESGVSIEQEVSAEQGVRGLK